MVSLQEMWSWYVRGQGIANLDPDDLMLYRKLFFAGAAACFSVLKVARERENLPEVQQAIDKELIAFRYAVISLREPT